MSQLISSAGLDVRDGVDGEKERYALETHIPADSDHVEPICDHMTVITLSPHMLLKSIYLCENSLENHIPN
jgi:hypothetical protein